jgi:hypothetical protein
MGALRQDGLADETVGRNITLTLTWLWGRVLTLDEKPSTYIRDIPIFSSERMLHKDYYRKSSVGKQISGRGSQGAWRQNESNFDFDFEGELRSPRWGELSDGDRDGEIYKGS